MNIWMRSLRVGYNLYVVSTAVRVITAGTDAIISGIREKSVKQVALGVAKVVFGSLAQNGAIDDIVDDFSHIRKEVCYDKEIK